MEFAPRKLHIPRLHPSLLALAVTGVLCAQPADGAVTIRFSGGGLPGLPFYLSDGTTLAPTDSGIFFELGTFTDGFVPTADNTDQWLDHWVLVNDAAGQPLPQAKTPFTMISSIFGDQAGFRSELELEHNNGPFAMGARGYVWGYDNRTEEGAGEWILMTNSTGWLYPDSGNAQGLPQTWSVATAAAGETVVGSVSPDGLTVTFGSVSVAGAVAVPELSSTNLLAFGLLTFLVTIRRRPAAGRARAPHAGAA